MWVALLGLCVTAPAAVADPGRNTRGVRLALEGRCLAARPELEREVAEDPAAAHSAWRLGQCALRARDYAASAEALSAALEVEGGLEGSERAEAQLDLARALFHSGDLVAADAALASSRQALSDEALWQLYSGIVALQRGEPQRAVDALERAVEINANTWRRRDDPEAVEPVASYYLGLALRAAGEKQRALVTLRGVADGWAGTSWAEQADRSIEESETRRAWLTLGAGMEYDDNVVLAGRDTPLPENISDEGDLRGVWLARGGFDLGQWGNTSAGVLGSYRGRAHVDGDLRNFDSHFPTASLWLNQALSGRTHLRLRYDLGYAWVDEDPFLWTNAGELSLLHAWSPRQTSALQGSLFADDYLFRVDDVPDGPGNTTDPCPDASFPICGPPGVDEGRERDRDGWGFRAGLAHAVVLPLRSSVLPDPTLRAGYAYQNFDAEGREYSHQAHRLFAGIGWQLPFGIGLDVDGDYTNRRYRHPSTFPELEALTVDRQFALRRGVRSEDVYSVGARIGVPIHGPLSAAAHYRYRDNRSTADVFDYEQHVVGLIFSVTFGRKR